MLAWPRDTAAKAVSGPEPLTTRRRRGNRRWQPRPCTCPNHLRWRSLAALLAARSPRSVVLVALVVALLAHESSIEGVTESANDLRVQTMIRGAGDSRFSFEDTETLIAACIGMTVLIALRGGHLEDASPSSRLA